MYDDWKELRRFVQVESSKPLIGRSKNLDSVALLAERKEKQLLKFLPNGFLKEDTNMVSQLGHHLRAGEAIINFDHYQRMSSTVVGLWYGAFILRYDQQQPLFINVCSEEKLNELINYKAANKIDDNPQAFYPSNDVADRPKVPGDEIFRSVWKPVQPYLKGITTVYIVSDGVLHKIAFHALPDSKGGYVCDHINIRYLYHCNDICEDNFRVNKKPAGIQLWGGLRYDTTETVNKAKQETTNNWNYLKGTAAEVQAIKKLCNSAKISCELYAGRSGTEAAFRKNYGNALDIVHIATHGQFDADYYKRKPEFSVYSNLRFTLTRDPMKQVALIMAGRNNILDAPADSDALLNANEVTQLRSREKQLVVLSACETGIGDIISTEGVYGMVRAFKMAGAQRMLISLWKIPDQQTKEMMEAFYRLLLNGKPIYLAFREAQQYMRKRYPPFFWGGFVLVE